MVVFLVRHPAPDIEPGRCYGRLDIDLSAQGRADLPRLTASLPRIPVWTSPARRCRRVADLLSPAPIIDPRLQELDFGAWEGLRWDDVPRAALDAWAAAPASFAPQGGESGAMLLDRVRSVCRDLPDHCIVISHGGPLKLMAAILRGQTPDLLAPAPPLGSITPVHPKQHSTVSTAHSTTTAQPPSTSPVNPPI
jgi:alpha-ribazole phosphatase